MRPFLPRRLPTLVLAAATLAAVAAAPAVTVTSTTPATADEVDDLDNALRAHGRLQDQSTNPAYHVALAQESPETFVGGLSDQLEHPDRPSVTLSQTVFGGTGADAFRHRWEEQGRGVQVAFEYENRYGARIQGHVWAPNLPFTDPVTGTVTNGPLPGVVITTGSIQGYEEMYLWAAQGLAEAGYVVMTYDVQGQGHSETFGHRPDGSLWCGQDGCPGVPFQQAANFFEGTEDALDWFVSDSNPLVGLLDDSRIGLAGHSLGASAVTAVGNREVPVPSRPDIDVAAVVGWDNISLPATDPVSGVELAPRVPTLGQNAEYFFNVGPPPTDPDAGTGTFERFRDAGVDSYQVALRSSTHLEWTYIPYILPASSEGERVAMHYTLAWFDRYLKGGGTAELLTAEQHAQRADARRRLLLTDFDGSADASAIGAGTYDAATNSNVPHTLAGEPVADHLSRYLRSAYAFDGFDCTDMLAGC